MTSSILSTGFLWGYARPYRRWIALGPLCLLIEVGMDLALPRLMARIVDQGLVQHDAALIGNTLLVMLACIAIGCCGGVGCTIFSMRAGVGSAADLRRDLFAKVLSLPMADVEAIGRAALITSLGADVLQLQQFLIMVIRGLLRSVLLLGGSLLLLFCIDARLALIVLAAAALALAALWALARRATFAFDLAQSKLDDLNGALQDNLAGLLTVKAFAREAQARASFAALNAAHTDAARRGWRWLAWNTPLLLLLLNGALALVLWRGGAQWQHGASSVGAQVNFINYITIALAALTFFGLLLAQFARADVAARRIASILALPSRQDGAARASARNTPGARGAIVFENVSFAYPGQARRPVLRDISFAIEPGCKVALVGWSAAGKSTLAALLARLYEPDSGRILVDGVDIRTFGAAELRARIGFAAQESRLFSASVFDNIALGRPDAPRELVYAAARSAQLHDFIRSLPQAYATPLGRGGAALSGGQRQRLTVARALLHGAPIFVFDASDSALDARTAAALRQALRRDLRASTCLFISQRPAELTEMDRILVLEEGRLVAQGTHTQLLAQSRAYRALLARDELAVERAP